MKKMILSRRLVRVKAAELNKTLNEISKSSGMKASQIYRILDKEAVRLDTLYRLATALGCSICDLLEEVDEHQ